MDDSSTVSLNKNSKHYLCKLINFKKENVKLELEIFGGDSIRYCNIHQNDIVVLEIPLKKAFYKMKSKVIFIDKVDHHIILEKPLEGEKVNRRKNKRIETHMNMKINSINKKDTNTDKEISSNSIVVNISKGGVGIYTPLLLKNNDLLQFTFLLPNGYKLENIVGTICSKQESEYKDISKYGISFTNLNSEQQILIDDFFNSSLANEAA